VLILFGRNMTPSMVPHSAFIVTAMLLMMSGYPNRSCSFINVVTELSASVCRPRYRTRVNGSKR
jgi:hypothetical protein